MSEPQNLGDLIDRAADAGELALIELDEAGAPAHYTYGELGALATNVAAALSARDQRGERVAVLATNSAHYVATALGIMQAGLVAVPLNFRFPRGLIADVIANSGACLVFCDAMRVADVPPAFEAIAFDARTTIAAAERRLVSAAVPAAC